MRPSVTIVIPAWNEWEMTRACLETLRPTLGIRDQVVVVDNGSSDGTAAGLARYRWVRVVSHSENLGFAAGCNSGAAVATGDIVVFLNNDTLLPSRWLDGLLAPFADSTVGATGPRSNFVSGPQLVEEVPYAGGTTADLQRFARAWRAQHRGRTDEVTRLVGFCLAVRRNLFDALGGFDEQFGIGGAEDDDLSLRIIDSGHRLLITHESFVHHHGHRTFEANGVDWFGLQQQNLDRLAAKRGGQQRKADRSAPLLSACMIVKDEEVNLPACLAALDGVVDEVVIYDTGSTDRTMEIAREAGATVIEGYWDDDFGRARNVALDACRGMWILHVDADELAEEADGALRQQLRGLHPSIDALNVSIGNVGDDGQVGVWHTAIRVFRRGRARWSGRLHEQLVPTSGELSGAVSVLRLRHTGYTTEAIARGAKMDRNLRVAEQAVRDRGSRDAASLINLARSLMGAGRFEEAVEQFRLARSAAEEPALRRQALRFGAELLLQLGRAPEALGWIEELREVSGSSSMPDYLEGLGRLNLGEMADALACFKRIGDSDDVADEDLRIPGHLVAVRRAVALIGNSEWQEAAAILVAALPELGLKSAPWNLLAEAYVHGGLPLDDLLALDPDVSAVQVLGLVVNTSTKTGHAVAAHLWERGKDADRLPVVAFLRRLSADLDLQQTLWWSLRLRASGFGQECRLADFIHAPGRPVLDRLQAAAVLAALDDPWGATAVLQLARKLEAREIRSALVMLDAISPALLPSFVEALVGERRRVPAVAEALADLGAVEQATLLRESYVA